MSRKKIRYPEVDLNHWPLDFQSNTLPTELSGFFCPMLFSNKKPLKNEINTFLITNTNQKKNNNFLLIKKLYKIKTKTTRKFTFIAKIKNAYFLFYLKQWLNYSNTLLSQKETKTLLIKNSKLVLPISIQKKFLLTPLNHKPGFISNFNVQKKEQFRAALNKSKNLEFITINNLKNTKPNTFFFIQPDSKNVTLKEVWQKQLPIISIENLTNHTISEYPLYLNSFKNNDVLTNLLKTALTRKFTPKTWIKNIRQLFLQNLRLFKYLKNKSFSNNFSTQPQENTKKLKKWLNTIFQNNKIWIKKNKKKIKKKWYKKTTITQISVRFRNLAMRALTKKFYKNKLPNNTISFNLYNNSTTSWVLWQKFSRTINYVQKKKKHKKFIYFFEKLNNLKYLKKAILWNLIYEKNINTNTTTLKWLINPLIQTQIKTRFKTNFSITNYVESIQNMYKTIKNKIKQTKKKIPQPLPEFNTLWQANEIWLQEKEKKTLRAAELYKQLNNKFPSWWEFPIHNYKKLYAQNIRNISA